jgi:hypothetical protein
MKHINKNDPIESMKGLLNIALDNKQLLSSHVIFQSMLYSLSLILKVSLPSEWFGELLRFGVLLHCQFGKACINLLRGDGEPGKFGFHCLRTLQRNRPAANTADGVEIHSITNFLSAPHTNITSLQDEFGCTVEQIHATWCCDAMSIHPALCTDTTNNINIGEVGKVTGPAFETNALSESGVVMMKKNNVLINEVIVSCLSSANDNKSIFTPVGKEGTCSGGPLRRNTMNFIVENIQVVGGVCLPCLQKIINSPLPGDNENPKNSHGEYTSRQQGWYI